jgi:hypothetical protein
MGLARAEQETVIRWDEHEQEVRIWSASPKTWRRMARLGLTPHRETTTGGTPSGRFYRVPAERFRWGTKRKAVTGTVARLRPPAAQLAAASAAPASRGAEAVMTERTTVGMRAAQYKMPNFNGS